MNPALPENLKRRAAILRSLRSTLDAAGFIETETPVRIPAPANEPHILPPPSGKAFLRASPELQMKKLLAAGLERIYQIGPCFREGERGSRHAPEFTMLEWYRAPGSYRDILGDLKKMCADACRAVHGDTTAVFGGLPIDFGGEWEEIPVREAYRKWAGWDPVSTWDAERFDLDMALVIEPSLPKDRPCVLLDYPRQAASLARLSPGDSAVAERWEAYVGAMELANAFGELTDSAEQRRRFEAARAEKIALGEPPMPIDEAFLSALDAMPPAGGAALGVDRLVMVLLGTTEIDDVRPFLPEVGNLW